MGAETWAVRASVAADSIGVGPSGDADVDGLLVGSRWNATTLSYSFPTAVSQYDYPFDPADSFRAFNAAEKLAVEAMLAQVEGFTNLVLVRAATPGGGDLRFGSGETGYAGYAYYPGIGSGGDVWISDHHMEFGDLGPGGSLNVTILHEIGHALGLKHGHEFPALTPEHNTHEFSIMTYRSWSGAPEQPFFNGSEENGGYPQTFMMYDIAALQHMYGANFAHNAGDSVYRWDAATGEMSVNGAGDGAPHINRIFMTIWDGGGTDTYDLSNHDGGVRIDLRPGGWSTTSQAQLVDLNELGFDVPPTYARGNIANALLFQGDERSLIENAVGGAGNDAIGGNVAANRLLGGDGDDRLDGRAGDDRLEGGAGDDLLVGGLGLDMADYSAAGTAVKVSLSLTGAQDTGSAGFDSLSGIEGVFGSAYADELAGNGGANSLSGGVGDDSLIGGGGDDRLEGGSGADLLRGGDGFDVASYSGALVGVTVDLRSTGKQATGGGGADTLNGIEGLAGSAFADRFTGNVGANLLDGGVGADAMRGGFGDDIYVVDRSDDTVTEAAGGGVDTMRTSVSLTLAAQVEKLILTGSAAISGTGNALANGMIGNDSANALSGLGGDDRLAGAGGNDLLDGGIGSDRMKGGAGDDVFLVDNAADLALELVGQGHDTIRSALSQTLAANVEALVLTGTAAANGTGNGLANHLVGNGSANLLAGGRGNDVLEGRGGADSLRGGKGSDWASYASAGAGVVVSLAVSGAQRTGAAGMDTFVSIENLQGSGHSDSLTGNAAANILDGAAGNDSLDGGAGMDRLVGGTGADDMAGGTDDDTYVVDNAGDVAVEAMDGGFDIVESAVSYVLGANVEKLVLTGGLAIAGTGNDDANTLVGNWAANLLKGGEGNDIIDGGLGADRMVGGKGSDTYYVDDADDVLVEAVGNGFDTVFVHLNYAMQPAAAVENVIGVSSDTGLAITGSATANIITGTVHFDALEGGGGDDILIGGVGGDLLTGGDGADTFLFRAFDVGFGLFAVDRVQDFAPGTDLIDLSGLDADEAALGDQAFEFIGNDVFSGTAGELRYHVSDGGVIAASGFTWLEGDVDGDGAADFQILLSDGAIPVATDFVL